MARGPHWTLTFRSAQNTPCRIYIYTNGYEGDPIVLNGAPNPFYWQEDTDSSLLKLVRSKTGYLSVIEEEYGALDDLRPTSDTSHYIEFYYGTLLYFNGYLQAQTFDNKWVASPREMSFPILSPVGIMPYMKFSQPTFAPDARDKVSIWDLMKEAINGLNAAYEKVVFPAQVVNEGQYINSLVYCPYSDMFSVSDGSIYTMFSPETYLSFFEALCNLYGWVMHDTPTALVFDDLSRPQTQKTYYEIYVEDLGTGSTPTASVVTTQGFLDLFNIYGSDHTITTERGISYLNIGYEGSFPKSSPLPMEHCVKYNKENAYDSFGNEAGAVLWLRSIGPEMSGNMLKYNGSLLVSGNETTRPQDVGVYPVCFALADGSEKKCLFYEPNTSWQSGQEVFSLHYIEHPYGDLHVSMKLMAGSLLHLSEASNTYKFVFRVSVDGLYYNSNTGEWDSTTPWNILLLRQNNDTEFTSTYKIPNVPNHGTLTFTLLTTYVDLIQSAMLSIDSFDVKQGGETFAEYMSNEKKDERKILYNSSGKEESITMKMSFSKKNTNQITDDDGLATRQSINARLGNDKTIIEVCARQPLVLPELSMFGVFRFLEDTLYWNILSSAFYPHDDYYKIKLIH